MTASQPFPSPWGLLSGITLTPVPVDHVGGLSGTLTGLSVYVTNLFDLAISGPADPAVADVRWVEGYNHWCASWAAAQSRTGAA